MSEKFCPLHEAKLRKNTLFIDQSAFSNFARYVINLLIRSWSRDQDVNFKTTSYLFLNRNFALKFNEIVETMIW